MTTAVKRIVDEVRRLDRQELEELLSWLAEHELSEMDEWDKKIERDSQPGGRLTQVLRLVRKDAAAKTNRVA